jgi:hypothetical protein
MAAMKSACLAALALVPALAAAPAREPQQPDAAEVVAKAGARCLEFWDGFRQFVAEEHDVQQVFSKTGTPQRRRLIGSDYYIVRTPSSRPDDRAGLTEFRDVLAVDGKRIRRDPQKLMALLTAPGASSQAEQCRILSAANQHNLLFGSALQINFSAGLAGYVLADAAIPTTYRLAPELARNENELVVCFEEGAAASRAQQGVCVNPSPLPGAGCAYLSRRDYSVVKVEVTVTLGSGPLRFRMMAEYQDGPGGVRVPSRRVLQVLHPKWKGGLAGQAEATYSNYRRFTSESTIGYEPIQ